MEIQPKDGPLIIMTLTFGVYAFIYLHWFA